MKSLRSASAGSVTASDGALLSTAEDGSTLRVSALTQDIFRVSFLPDGVPRQPRTWAIVGDAGEPPRAGRLKDDASAAFPAAPAGTIADGVLSTSSVAVAMITARDQHDIGTLRLVWSSRQHGEFAADRAHGAYQHDVNGHSVRHCMQRDPGEVLLGFGESSGAIDKAGRRLRVACTDGIGYDAAQSDPLYKHSPCFIVVTPCASAPGGLLAYGIVYDNYAQAVLDNGAEISGFRGSYRYYEAEAGDIEMYCVHGPSVIEVVERVSWLVGRSQPPPRYALGYMGSTMVYTEQPDAQSRLREFARLCAEHGIPCGAFHLSSGYTMDKEGNRCVFTWNTDRVPEPRALFDDFHAAGMRVLPNIKPWLLVAHPAYAELAAKGGLLKTAEGRPLVGRFWKGSGGTSAEGSYIDFCSEAGYAFWVGSLRSSLIDLGADAAWNDNNEVEVDQDDAACGDAGATQPIGLLGRPLQALLMARASSEALRSSRPLERPFVISRSGGLGTQRYAAQTWSGDNTCSWATLRYNIPMGLSLALCGWAGVGHDVGGFFGARPSPELFVRWVQQGVLQPRLVIHSGIATDNSWKACNEPWMHPEVTGLVRGALLLRSRLVPLLSSLHLECYLTGRPVARALACHFPDSIAESFLYTLGPSLLAASVLAPLDSLVDGRWDVRLPKGEVVVGGQWCNVESGEWHAAGSTASLPVGLSSVPLFAAGGAVLPLDLDLPARIDPSLVLTAVDVPPSEQLARPPSRRALMVFAPPGFEGELEATFYEDDGLSPVPGPLATLDVTVSVAAAGGVSVRILASGSYALPYREVVVILPRGDQRAVLNLSSGGTVAVETGYR